MPERPINEIPEKQVIVQMADDTLDRYVITRHHAEKMSEDEMWQARYDQGVAFIELNMRLSRPGSPAGAWTKWFKGKPFSEDYADERIGFVCRVDDTAKNLNGLTIKVFVEVRLEAWRLRRRPLPHLRKRRPGGGRKPKQAIPQVKVVPPRQPRQSLPAAKPAEVQEPQQEATQQAGSDSWQKELETATPDTEQRGGSVIPMERNGSASQPHISVFCGDITKKLYRTVAKEDGLQEKLSSLVVNKSNLNVASFRDVTIGLEALMERCGVLLAGFCGEHEYLKVLERLAKVGTEGKVTRHIGKGGYL